MKSKTPKLLHNIAGKPMINWLLDTVKDLNPSKTVVVIGPDMDDLAAACVPHDVAIQKEQNGTGDAVKAAMPFLDNVSGNVLVLLGDCPLITTTTLKQLIKVRTDEKSELAVLGCKLHDPSGYGRLVMQKNSKRLDAIVEDKDANETQAKINLINTGVFCADGERLSDWLEHLDNKNAQKEFYITQIPEIIKREGGQTVVAVTEDSKEIQGCNTRSDLSVLERTVQDNLRHRFMVEGVTLHDPNTVYFSHDTHIENDVVIEPNVFLGVDVVVRSGAHIKAFSHIEGTTIEEEAVIGPFARLRPGTRIGTSVRIGNFVEVKKSEIGAKSKIGHLAYVGDCLMGQDVNFSAGAITVNYDGYKKHRTTIGDGAMIGSDVSLVAPVQIGSRAFIAAGSTITSDVPDEALAIARKDSVIKSGWATEHHRKNS